VRKAEARAIAVSRGAERRENRQAMAAVERLLSPGRGLPHSSNGEHHDRSRKPSGTSEQAQDYGSGQHDDAGDHPHREVANDEQRRCAVTSQPQAAQPQTGNGSCQQRRHRRQHHRKEGEQNEGGRIDRERDRQCAVRQCIQARLRHADRHLQMAIERQQEYPSGQAGSAEQRPLPPRQCRKRGAKCHGPRLCR
jgi:hypothetical protein